MAYSLQPYPMLRIGPAGWDYQDWRGVVYPPGLQGIDRLAFLASWFKTVEINVTFYRPLAPPSDQPLVRGDGGIP